MGNAYSENLEKLKKQFIHLYIIIMCSMLFLYIIIFKFFIHSPAIVWYLIAGLLFLSYTYILVRKKHTADCIIHWYMMIAPLYNMYVMVTFWDNSIGTFVMLFPLPLAAYVFFSKKEVIAYSIYMVINIFVCFLIHEYSGFQFTRYSRDEVVVSDIVIFVFNLIFVALLLIYNDKINKLKLVSEITSQKTVNNKAGNTKIPPQPKTDEKESIDDKAAEKLFERLEDMMNNEKLFKNPSLNISALSIALNVNYTYLSKIIRYKGYQNFNNYLNKYRINYVKKLINENNLQKVTLMYIYTEAGFSNQATFNRVFKQIEEITPSEYISKMQEKTKEI